MSDEIYSTYSVGVDENKYGNAYGKGTGLFIKHDDMIDLKRSKLKVLNDF